MAALRPVAPGPAPVSGAALWGVSALALLAGSASHLQLAALWPAWQLLWLGGGAVLSGLVAWALMRLGRRPPKARQWLGLLLWALAVAMCAFVLTSVRAEHRLAQALPAALEGQDLVLTGRVDSLPRQTLVGTRFVFEVDSATHGGRPVVLPARVSLGWYRGVDEDALLGGPPEDLRAGQRWRLPVRLKQPHGSFNPHGFDLELWLFEQNIRASGYVRARAGAQAVKLVEHDGLWLQRWRQDVRDAIYLQVRDPALAGVLAALSVGDQAAIERDDWDLFRITGVAHLMSISGLHVTMLAWLAAALLGRVWRWWPRAMVWLPAPQAARWGGLLVAFGYALFAGWGVPAQRTVCMLAVVVLLRSLGLRWPLHAVLLAAAVAVVLLDPWALLQPGFWLSFVAVGLLAASAPVYARDPVLQANAPGWQSADGPGETGQVAGRMTASRPALLAARAWHQVRPWLSSGVRSQVVATIGLAPLSMVFFQQLSVVGFVANLVAIPLVTLFITPLALLGMVLAPLWSVAAALVQGLSAFLQALASVPGAVWTAAAAPPWAMASGLLAGLLAVLPLPWRLRAWALPLMLPLLWPPVARPPVGQFEVVAADVGQGTAVLVRTQNHLLVYDTGAAYSHDSDAGMRVLLPLLRGRGERQVDLLMLSHRDTDHVGGAASLMAGLPVRALSSSLAPDHALLARGVAHTPCQAGQGWTWDGVQFQVLHPLAQDLAPGPAAVPGMGPKANALSCVLRVQAAEGPGRAPRSVLLTGDIEAAQEAALVQRLGPALRSQVLLVPHHGSRTSSTGPFLDAVQPQQAVVQAGYRSRFGHPVPDVLARYSARGIAVQRSDRCGAWTWPAVREGQGDGEGVCERQQRRRYWHHPVAGPPVGPAQTR
jgi:competence protein ComEC